MENFENKTNTINTQSTTSNPAHKALERSLLFFIDVDNILKHAKLTEDFATLLTKLKNMSADIFACHNFFQDFPQNTYLNHILNIIQMSKSSLHLKDILTEINKYTIEIYDTKFSKEEIFLSTLIFLYLFLQESTYGPSFFFIKETEKVDHNKDIEKFKDHFLFKLEESLEEIRPEMLDYLTIEGERPYANMKLLIFYIIAYEGLKSNLFSEFEVNKLWRSRVLFMHNKMLKEPVSDIQLELFELISKFEIDSVLQVELEVEGEDKNEKEKIKINNNIIKGMLQLERSYYNLKYYKYKQADILIEESKDLFNLKIGLTGKLGRKTKYQETDIAILVIESESSTLDKKVSSLNIDSNSNSNSEPNSETPITITLDEESPLLEKPRITSTDDSFPEPSNTNLSLFDQMYVTALINSFKASMPDEDLLRESIVAYTNKSLEKSNDWLVYSKLLLQKALAEDKRSKTIERSLLQIQSLCDQYNDRAPSPYNRLKYYFTIDYPFIWNLKKFYAQMFMNYGAVITAFDIFKELSMYEECIQCLYVAGKNERALEFANEILKTKSDPGIYCVLGELQNKEEYFFKALEVSGGKYTRAYRCLGKFYSSVKNDLKLSLEYYEKALEINALFPNIWFTVGCIYLRLSNWEKAVNAFSKSVGIDDSNSEGWANLGIAFSQMKKTKEAIKCLEEGLKRQRTNWKICENLLLIAIEAKDLNKIIYAINHLFSLDKYSQIKPAYFYSLTTVFLSILHTLNLKQIDQFKNKIYQIFEKFTMKDGVTPEVWDLYALFVESVEIEVNNEKISNEDRGEYYHAIVEIRLKQMRGLMIAELWEKEEKVIEKISKVILKIYKDLEMVNKEEVKNEVRGFVGSIQTKIDKFYKLKEFDISIKK